MKFKMEFEIANTAFDEDCKDEMAYMLIDAANDIQDGNTDRTIMDIHGNTIGEWHVECEG